MKDYVIGIDAGFTNMGIAIRNLKNKDVWHFTGSFFAGVAWMKKFFKDRGLVMKNAVLCVMVENPDKNSNIFGMWSMVKGKIDKMVNYQLNRHKKVIPKIEMGDVQSVFLIAMKRASDVGKSKAAGMQIIELLHNAGINVIQVAPSERDKAFKKDKKTGKITRLAVMALKMPTKTTQAQYLEYTGFKGSTSEHARDAGTLISGRARPWFELQIAYSEKEPKSYPKPNNGNYKLVDKNKKLKPF